MANLNPDAAVTSSNTYSCCANQVGLCLEKTGTSISKAFIKCTNDYAPYCLAGGILCGLGGTTLIAYASTSPVPVIGNSGAASLGMIAGGSGCFSMGSVMSASCNRSKNQDEAINRIITLSEENSGLIFENEMLKENQVITYQPSPEHEAFLQARQERLDEIYPPVTTQPRTAQGNSFFDNNEDADPRFLIRSASFTSLESDAED